MIAFWIRRLKGSEKLQTSEALAKMFEDQALEKTQASVWFYKCLSVLWLLVVLALGFAWKHYSKAYLEVSAVSVGNLFSMPLFEPVLIGGETEKEQWFLGLADKPKLEQKRKLHESEPDNPLYYRHYVDAYHAEYESLPPGYQQTIARIDPENGYWLFLAAVELAKNAWQETGHIGKREQPKEVNGKRIYPLSRPISYQVLDADTLEQAIVLFEQGCALPEFRIYTREQIVHVDEIHDRLSPPLTLLSSTNRALHYYSAVTVPLRFRKAIRVLGAALHQAVEEQDRQQFYRLATLRDVFLRKLFNGSDKLLIDALIYRSIVNDTALSLMHASRELGLEEEAMRYQKQAEQLNDLKNERQNRLEQADGGRSAKIGILHQQSILTVASQVMTPPPYEVADFKAMRMAEHEFASQWMTIAICLILPLMSLPVFFARFFFPGAIRAAATRAVRLLKLGDWIRVFFFGVLVPVVLHLLLTMLTPLGGRGYGIGGLGYQYPALPLLTLVIGIWMASTVMLQSRLAKRLRILPQSRCQLLPNWIYLGIAIVIYVFGYLWTSMNADSGDKDAVGECMVILFSMHCMLLVFFAFWALSVSQCAHEVKRFGMLATVNGLMPCIPAAMLCLLCLLPIHLAGERRWVSKDTSLLPDSSKPNYGLYESKVALEHLRETNAIAFPCVTR